MNSLDHQVGGDHYQKHGDLQPWNVLREYLTPEELRGYHKGTAIVYLLRERDKGGDEDVRKAAHTLQHLGELLAKQEDGLRDKPDNVFCIGTECQFHNPAGLESAGDGYRFAYTDETRQDCHSYWSPSREEWVRPTRNSRAHLCPLLTYRVKLP